MMVVTPTTAGRSPWRVSIPAGEDVTSSIPFRAEQTARREKDRVIWSPTVAGVEFKDVPKAPKPAKTPAERLRQMKAIAEGFKATMTGWSADNSDQEALRLLPRPLHRYDLTNVKDPEPKLLDGALFAFVQGTDPEVVMAIEAVGTAEDAVWQYACVRATSGGLEVKLGDEVVWTAKKHPANRDPKLPTSRCNESSRSNEAGERGLRHLRANTASPRDDFAGDSLLGHLNAISFSRFNSASMSVPS